MVVAYTVERLDGSDLFFIHPANPAGAWSHGSGIVLRLAADLVPPAAPGRVLGLHEVLAWRDGLAETHPGAVMAWGRAFD